MTDLHTTQYNIINALGKYNTNPLRDEFKSRVEITHTRCPLSGEALEGVVFWNKDKRRVVRWVPLVPDEDDEK